MNRMQTKVATILALLALVCLVVISYLAFMFPKTIDVWKEQGRALSVVEQLTVNLSRLCTHFGLILLPLFLFAVIGCTIWAAVSLRGCRNNGQPSSGANAAAPRRSP